MQLHPTIKILLFMSFSVNAITFDTHVLQDKSSSNYIEFINPRNSLANSFEKIAADFNGDGIDDILSLGGDLRLIEDLVLPGGAVVPSAPMSLMLNQNGEYVYKDIGINHFSTVVNIVDIDADNDLDIVMLNGKIAINDGHADFSQVTYSSNHISGEQFFTADIDADNDLDIISKNTIFLNIGNLQFTEQVNEVTSDSDLFSVQDINKDGVVDLVYITNNELQSWLNDGLGNFTYLSSTQLPEDSFIIHALSLSEDNLQNFLMSYHTESQDNLVLLSNDGQGNFTGSKFVLDTNGLEFDTLKIGKFYNRDANGNGSDDLWIAGIFKNSTSCENSQNFMIQYQVSKDGNLQYGFTLHSDGMVKDLPLNYRVTVDSFPTLVDLNNDHLIDVVFTGTKPQTWLAQESPHSQSGINFRLSPKSISQYSNGIDVIDFNNDGYNDIFSSAHYTENCQTLEQRENLYTASQYVHSQLWLNDADGKFEPFVSNIAGGNSFLRPYEYAIFANLDGSNQQNILATLPANETLPRRSYYIYPRLVDPGLAIQLPEVTVNAQVVNLDSNGIEKEIVMIADTEQAPIIVLSLNNGNFIEIARFDFGVRDGEVKLADMDGDGNIDIVANTKRAEQSIKIWYNNGNRTFNESESFAQHSFGMALVDFNSDGKKDIFTSNRDIWMNQGNREFTKIQYNSNFWSTPSGLPVYSYLVPKNIEVTDFNQDGKEDLIFNNASEYYVFINESSLNHISFYLAFSTDFNLTNNQPHTVLADMDNDNKIDFVYHTANDIRINRQLTEKPITGLYFDPVFNGHGHSIDVIGRDNLYYSVFYSYDEFGKPQWFSSLNRFTEFDWGFNKDYYLTVIANNRNIRFLYDYTLQSAQVDNNSENMGRLIYSGSNEKNDFSAFSYGIGDEFNNWSLQPIIANANKPENDFSGIWWAGNADSGWGISLNFIETDDSQTVVSVLYIYDENGEPRWLIGTKSGFETNQDTIIEMEQINGYGRLQNQVELTRNSAGTITLNLKQASRNLNEAGTLSMDIHYPDDQLNDNWTRDNIPFALLSKPKR